jgi:hypothetical protein
MRKEEADIRLRFLSVTFPKSKLHLPSLPVFLSALGTHGKCPPALS